MVQRYVEIVRGRNRLLYTYVHTVYEDNRSHLMSQVRMQYSLNHEQPIAAGIGASAHVMRI